MRKVTLEKSNKFDILHSIDEDGRISKGGPKSTMQTILVTYLSIKLKEQKNLFSKTKYTKLDQNG